MSSDLLAVVPAYQEERNVGAVVRDLKAAGYDVVVIDDGSRDRTAAVASAAGAVVVRLPLNLGVGGALRCGFRYAVDNRYRTVVQCDGDGQHPAGEISKIVAGLDEHDAQLCIGSRFAEASGDFTVSGMRRLAMRLLSGIASRAAGRSMSDTTSGLRGIREPLLSAFADDYPTQYLGDTFEALVGAARSGYVVVEVPVSMRPRASGTSSAGTGAALRYVARAVLTVLIGNGKRVQRQPAASGALSGSAVP